MQLYWSSDGVRFYSKGVFGYVKVVHINNSAQKYNRHTCKTNPDKMAITNIKMKGLLYRENLQK